MSIAVMTKVWKHAPYAGGELNLLLALADWADDDGVCFPSVAKIAEKSRMTERQAYRVLADFRAAGVLETTSGGGRGKRNTYKINTDKMSGFKPPKKDDAGVRVSTAKTLTSDTPETLTSATENPDTHDNSPTPPNRKNHQVSTKKSNTPLPPSQASGERVASDLGEAAVSDLDDLPVTASLAELCAWSVRRKGRENEIRRLAQAELDRRAGADPPGWVMLECGFVGGRLRKVIAEVIALEVKRGAAAAATAQAMVGRWRDYQREAQWLRWQCAPQKFFAQGYWRPETAWPVDQQRVQLAREARVGIG